MTLNDVLTGTKKFITVIADCVDNLSFDANNKNLAAAGCIHLSIGHHAAIAFLVENQHFGSAAALVRPQFEAFLRGAWLHRCASEAASKEFLEDKDPPSPTIMIKELEQFEDFKSLVLSLFKQRTWDAMCSYTHAGGLHITRRISATEIIQNYYDEEMINMMEISNLVALYSSVEISTLTKNQNVSNTIYGAYRELTGQS